MKGLSAGFRNYGFVWLVILYICGLAMLDGRGYFEDRVRAVLPLAGKPIELHGTTVSASTEKSNRIEFNVDVPLRGIKSVPENADRIKLLAKYYPHYAEKLKINLYDELKIRGKILPLPKPRNPGQFDYGRYLLRKGYSGTLLIDELSVVKPAGLSPVGMSPVRKIHKFFDGFIGSVRGKMISSVRENLPPAEAGILTAMFTGDRSGLTTETRTAFIDSGVMHTLVVSGLHVGYVVAVFWFVVRWMPLGSIRARWLMITPPLMVYCMVTGAAPPVLRSTLIVFIFIIAFCLGREKVTYHAFALSALIILVFDPQAVFGASMQLSYGACLGIVYISPKLINACKPWFEEVPGEPKIITLLKKLMSGVVNLFFVSVGAQLATAPLLAGYFHKLSVVSLVSNLIVVPAVGIILWSCFGLLFAHLFFQWTTASIPFVMPLSGAILKTFSFSCYALSHLLIKTVTFFSELPGAIVRTGEPSFLFMVSFYALLITVFKFKKGLHRLAGIVCLCAFVLLSTGIRKRKGKLEIIFLDVGQGNAVFVRTPLAENIFIDCGGETSFVGERVLMPFLWSRGISRIDRIFITSDNWTYYSGLRTLIEELKVGKIVVCDNLPETADELKSLLSLAAEKKIAVERLQKDGEDGVYLTQDRGSFMIETFCQPPTAVIKLTYKNFSMLFTSDATDTFIESISEKTGRVNILQIPRNGQQRIPDGLLKKLLPQHLVVSTNKTNIPPRISLRQHPPPNHTASSHHTVSPNHHTLPIFSTAARGAITITSNGRKYSLSSVID